jgi:hypothetical protein
MSATRSRLKAVAPKAAAPSKPKVLIFGKPGVGKTWQALDFPSVFYIDTEGGADLAHYTDKLERSGGVYLGPAQGSLDFATVLEQVQALATEQHEFRTLVIDSITKLYTLEITREGERLGDKNAFGADKKPAVAYMRRIVSWLVRLDMNVILIAHEKEVWGLDDKGNRAVTGVSFDCWDKLEYELHLALNIQKRGPSRIARVTKSRLQGFPDGETFAWTYDMFADRYGRDVIEKTSAPVVVASPEQVAELTRLLDVVKMPDGWLSAVLTRANVDRLDDMEADKIEKLLTVVKEKLS